MSRIISWVTSDRLMKRWKLDNFELRQIIESGILPIFLKEEYDQSNGKSVVLVDKHPTADNMNILLPPLKDMVFNIIDVERIEKKNPDFLQNYPTQMGAKEAQEFGRLKLEKEKWDKSIKAAVQAVLFCKDQNKPITRKELWDELTSKRLADIPDTTFEKIWKAIPQEYRSKGGRPKKE